MIFLKNKNKWPSFFVIYFAAITVSISQLKIVPIMNNISSSFNISMSQISWLMSVFTVAGVILAIPSAAILNYLGSKKLLLILMATLCIGNIIGAFTNSYYVLLISRAIEGISFAMIILVGVVLISDLFGDKAGSTTGIFTTFAAVGSVIAMNLTLPVVNSLGLNSIWLVVAALSALSFILVALIIKEPDAKAENDDASSKKASLAEAISNGSLWLVAICQFCVAFVLFTFFTIYPSLLTDLYSLDATVANFYAGLLGLFAIPFGVIAGVIIDKSGNAPLVTLISFIGLAVSCFIMTSLGPSTYILHVALLSFFCALIIPAVLYIAPGVAKQPALIGYSVALVNMLYYVGIFSGSPVILSTIEKSGWSHASNILIVVSVIGIVAMGLFMTGKRKQA